MEQTRALLDLSNRWVLHLLEFPGYKDWKNDHLNAILQYGDPEVDLKKLGRPDFRFTPEIEAQHEAITGFHALLSTRRALEHCQYYFARYTLKSTPVSREEHLRYCVEMFLSRMYEFSEKMKKCLNAINRTIAPEKLNVSVIIKQFARDYASDLKARNLIHHHQEYRDIGLSSVSITKMLSANKEFEVARPVWESEVNRLYRLQRDEWIIRVKNRAIRLELYQEEVARTMVEHCAWLHVTFPS